MRRTTALCAIAAVAVLAGACASTGAVSTAGMPGQLEPIHAAAFTRDTAVFWVSSNGCTRKADLNPTVRTDGDGSVITLRRVKEDRCRNVRPEGVELRWSFQELGLPSGARVSVENPYQLPAS